MISASFKNPVNIKNLFQHLERSFQGTITQIEAGGGSSTAWMILSTNRPLSRQTLEETFKEFAAEHACESTMYWENYKWVLSVHPGIVVAEVVVEIQSERQASLRLAVYNT